MTGVRGVLMIVAGAAILAAVVATAGFLFPETGESVAEVEGADAPKLPAASAIDTDCPFAVPSGRTVRCGTLVVPESWSLGDGPPVTIFYAVTPADGDVAPAPDPVLVLNGGPGQSGSELIESAWDTMAAIRRGRDIIFVDQRGTGFSKPGLFCPSLDPVAYWHGGLTAEDAERCRRPFADQGYDLARFNTLESAKDLVALRHALGLGVWNLHGTSYGTVLGLEVVRQDPAGVRSIVLNSPNLTWTSWLDLNRMEAIRAVFLRLFEDCRNDAACSEAYPDLQAKFLDLAERLRDQPISISYTDPRTEQEVSASLDFQSLLTVLTTLIGFGDTAGRVPQWLWHVHQVTHGDTTPHMPLLSWLYMPPPFWTIMRNLAYGLNAAIGCREVRPWVDADGARAAASLFYPYVIPSTLERDYDAFCPAWDLPPAPDALRQPVRSSLPTLILTGVYDTLTPTRIADTVAGTLENASVLRFSGLGHDVYAASSCARAAVADFLEAPEGFVAPACVADSGPPEFIVP